MTVEMTSLQLSPDLPNYFFFFACDLDFVCSSRCIFRISQALKVLIFLHTGSFEAKQVMKYATHISASIAGISQEKRVKTWKLREPIS